MARVIKVDKVVDAEEGQLRVWWSRNTEPIEYHIASSQEEAIRIINRLTHVDLQSPSVAANACGLEMFEDGDWCEWYDSGQNSITDLIDES